MKDLNDIGKEEIGTRKVRKRDALKVALRSLRLPKFSESDKLYYTGLIIVFMSIAFAMILTILTKNLVWIFLIVVGYLICLWFIKASEVMDEWEWKNKPKRVLEETEEK